MASEYLKDHGHRLARQGFKVIPISPGKKFPANLPGWQNIDADEDLVRKWASNGFAGGGVGILAEWTPGCDIDVYDPVVVDDLIKMVSKVTRCDSLIERTGRFPKTLIPFRTSKPFTKIATPVFIDPDGNESRVEFLGKGQQWVSHHIHPDTGKPYEWGPKDLVDLHHDDLHEITADEATEICRRATDLFRSLGWEQKGQGQSTTAESSDDPLENVSPPADLTDSQVQALLEHEDFDDRDNWIRIGMMLYHQYQGSDAGFDIWDTWSSQSEKYDADDCRRVWSSFSLSASRRQLTMRTLIDKYKKKHGELPSASATHDRAQDESSNESLFVSLPELMQMETKINWLIKGFLDAHSFCSVFGVSGVMKSFVALDIGLTLAAGLSDWHGLPVKAKGPVFYLAGEGFSGLSRRVKAWMTHHGIDRDIPFFTSRCGVALLDKSSAQRLETAVEKLVNEHGQPILIIVDTLNRNFGPGNENAAEDMTQFVAAIDHLKNRFNCTVLIVHHTGLNNQERARGSYVLFASLDWEYRLENTGDQTRKLTCTKTKDHSVPDSITFRSEEVDLGSDKDALEDDPLARITSIILKRDPASTGTSQLTKVQQVALDALKELVSKGEDRHTSEWQDGFVRDESCAKVHVNDWRDEACRRQISKSSETKSKSRAFHRARHGLLELGLVKEDNDLYQLG